MNPADLLDIDSRIHEPGRLAILAALVQAGGRLTWRELEKATGISSAGLYNRLGKMTRDRLIQCGGSCRPRSLERRKAVAVVLDPKAREAIDSWVETARAAADLLAP